MCRRRSRRRPPACRRRAGSTVRWTRRAWPPASNRARNQRTREPENKDLHLRLQRRFRKNLLSFHETARVVRGYNEEDNEVDLLSKAVDSMYDEMQHMKVGQERLVQNIAKLTSLIAARGSR